MVGRGRRRRGRSEMGGVVFLVLYGWPAIQLVTKWDNVTRHFSFSLINEAKRLESQCSLVSLPPHSGNMARLQAAWHRRHRHR